MDLWLSMWEDWRPHISTWLESVEEADLHHLGRLRIPSTLIEHVPAEEKHHLRWRVAWHQYHMLLGVTHLRRELPMLPRVETDDPPTQVMMVFKVKGTQGHPEPNNKKPEGAVSIQGLEEKTEGGNGGLSPHAPAEGTGSTGQATHTRHKSGSHKDARVHNIQTTGEKAVPCNSARRRAPLDVTMEDQSPTGVAPAKVLA